MHRITYGCNRLNHHSYNDVSNSEPSYVTSFTCKTHRLMWGMVVALLAMCCNSLSAQYYTPKLQPPAPGPGPFSPPPLTPLDSIMLTSPVGPTVPQSYDELMNAAFSADLKTPSKSK